MLQPNTPDAMSTYVDKSLQSKPQYITDNKAKKTKSNNPGGVYLSDNRPAATLQLRLINAGSSNLNNTNQPIQLVKFNTTAKDYLLNANKKKNGGFYTCEECGFAHKQKTYATQGGKAIGDGAYHVDHIKPNSKGGPGTIKNGRILCGTCNTSRGAGNAINVTGHYKYFGLHTKSKTHNFSKKDYQRRSRWWKKQLEPNRKGKKILNAKPLK